MNHPDVRNPAGGRGFGKAQTNERGLQNDYSASEALAAIPADLPRDEWVKIAMAAKSAGLSFDEFDQWSQNGATYKSADCRDTWKSINGNGGIGAGTLFHTAKEHGWTPHYRQPVSNAPARPVQAITAAPAQTPSSEAAEAVWGRCVPLDPFHPYPLLKDMSGEPLKELRQLPDDDKLQIAGNPMKGALVVPAYAADGTLQSLQFIPNSSPKMNLPGHPMKGARFIVGTITEGRPVYLVEGIGQSFAVWQATGCAAVASFGCSNMATVAESLSEHALVLVPDAGQEHKATETAAALGCKVAMMPEGSPANFDACDYVQHHGRQALADLLGHAQSFAPPPHPLTVEVPLDFEPHPPRWILPGLIAEGVAIIAGMRAVGKTTALLPLALTAAGLHESGYELAPRHWRHVVYVTEDTGQAMRILSGLCADLRLDRDTVAERFHLIAAKRLPPDLLVLAGDTLRERYSRTVDGVDVLPLVVLDTQAATVELESENDNAEASRAIAALKQQFAGLPVWLVAHVAKSAAPKRGADELTARGAGAFESDVNQVLYAVQDGEKRYLLTGKTRFEPRWRELVLDSYTDDVTATDEFGDTQHLTLRWSIARPLEAGERAKAREEAKQAEQKEAEAELRQKVRDAIRVAQQEGNPLSRNGVAARVQRKKQQTLSCIERLLSERWLFEAEIPRHARTNARRTHALFNLSTTQHETLRSGGTLSVADLPTPPNWQHEGQV